MSKEDRDIYEAKLKKRVDKRLKYTTYHWKPIEYVCLFGLYLNVLSVLFLMYFMSQIYFLTIFMIQISYLGETFFIVILRYNTVNGVLYMNSRLHFDYACLHKIFSEVSQTIPSGVRL